MAGPVSSVYALGLGYTAEALAQRLAVMPGAATLRGCTRREDRLRELRAAGIAVDRLADDYHLLPLSAHGCWLISAAPDAAGCPVFRATATLPAPDAVIYLSTTGVYGDRRGAWVHEGDAVSPSSERGERRVRAEQQWQARARRVALVRLPGIYGPGRSALDSVRAGRARCIVKSGQFFSRIHVHDLADGLAALLGAGVPGGVYHFADDEPAAPDAPIRHAAELLGQAPPPAEPYETADLSPMARSFYSECKRVGSHETRERLNWTPRFPSYREGLASLLAEEAAGP